MRSFIKNTLVFMIPIVVLFCLYFIMDPFRVVWNYDNYYCNGEIALNKIKVTIIVVAIKVKRANVEL